MPMATASATSDPPISAGQQSSRFLAHYDKLIYNVQKRRSNNNERRNLSLTEKILYGHGLDKDTCFISSNDHYSSSSFSSAPAVNLSSWPVSSGASFADNGSGSCGDTRSKKDNSVHDLAGLVSSHDKRSGLEFFPTTAAAAAATATPPPSPTMMETYAFPGGLLITNNTSQRSMDALLPASGSTHTTTSRNAGVLSTLCVNHRDPISAATTHRQQQQQVAFTELNQETSYLPPRIIGVRLQGTLSGWATPKDICLHISQELKKRNQDNKGHPIILEYHGPGTDSVSYNDRTEICTMTSELLGGGGGGGTNSNAATALFPFTNKTFDYLCTTGQRSLAYAASAIADVYLQPDQDAVYDDLIELQLDRLQPHVHGPFTLDRVTPLSEFKHTVIEEEWPEQVSGVTIIASTCKKKDGHTLSRVARVVNQARRKGLRVKLPLRVVLLRDDDDGQKTENELLVPLFESIGATVVSQHRSWVGGIAALQHKSSIAGDAEWNSVLSTCTSALDEELRFIGNPNTHAFVASPEIVIAMAFAGKLTFNPVCDRIIGRDGAPFQFTPSTKPLFL
ncbi:hypothetical protein BDB00DRAFT_807098 [Zychaea mexicana]|uniref:uncharacterized protein n=1 Tax=Zychaea mexicana TaxID=64656 RepID=UPI0022FF2D3D|nr:uncharacterized protein BDB00DRAFT_807098 [Zychaea mexicana]KAI9496771.1 hypothetical protein BDB00DRAFT_807098 [Zychaea mexicana]